jgi:glucosylglycerate synthase
MATVNPLSGAATASSRSEGRLLVLLAAMPPEQLARVIEKLAATVAHDDLLIATSDETAKNTRPDLHIVAAPNTNASWTVTAADYASALEIAEENKAGAVMMLGPECDSLSLEGLHNLASTIAAGNVDLAVSRYDLPPRAGLVNSAIIYPISRALFASPVRFPLSVDLGLSMRMAERLSAAAQRLIKINQAGAFLWPVSEGATAGFTIREVEVGSRTIPQPAEPDLNSILPMVAGSLFADVEAKAAFWQRPRTMPPERARQVATQMPTADGATDIAPMLQAFRLAYSNLQEIWSLVLPPNSLLGLKRLSLTEGAAFRMPDSLWARIIYDFLLAYRLRTINRGHLLGALIPLYLAWVASHINITAAETSPEQHVEAVTAAFVAEKPYLVARWRWPDRFNP